MMETVKIEWNVNHRTSQIYNSGVELALCSDDNKQVGTFVYCKDFFQDALAVFLHGGICNIYGYQYDPKTMPPCPQNNLRILLANSTDVDLHKKIPAVVDLLNQIEEKLGITKTTISQCENPPEKYKNGIYLLCGDKVWMVAPPAMSIWTLLARNGLQHTVGKPWEETINGIIDNKIAPAQRNDHVFLTYAKPGIDLLLEKGFEALFGNDQKANYPIDKAGRAMHHYSGAVAFGSKKAKEYFPNWFYPEKETTPPPVCFS